MAQLINVANTTGNYIGIDVVDTTQLIVQLSALSITKVSDKRIWLDGDLGYTITVTNVDERDPDDAADPGQPVDTVVVTDTIDPEIATLISGSVTVSIDGILVTNPTISFNADTGLLTVELGSLRAGSVAVINFRVNRV